MAKKKSMTMEGALQVILASEGDNPFRAMLEFIAQSALGFEMAEHLGAAPYERTEERTGYRNGYKHRILTTAVGDLHLLVPQDRGGTFRTSLFERYQRSDKALVLAMMEMYVKGVSTRKVAAVTEALCGRSFSSQLVSKLAKCLDEKVAEWRSRPLEGAYPYLVVDARYEKVRRGGRVISQGILICLGINSEGMREILAVECADTECETTWSDLFRDLKEEGPFRRPAGCLRRPRGPKSSGSAPLPGGLLAEVPVPLHPRPAFPGGQGAEAGPARGPARHIRRRGPGDARLAPH